MFLLFLLLQYGLSIVVLVTIAQISNVVMAFLGWSFHISRLNLGLNKSMFFFLDLEKIYVPQYLDP